MTDLSSLSDAQLQAIYSQPQQAAAPDLSAMSDADLMKAYAQPSTGSSGLKRVYITGKPDEATTPQPSLGDTLGDAAKSFGTGVAKGAIGLAGLPGDLSELAARGIDRMTQGISGLVGDNVAPRPDQPTQFGSADIQRGIEGVTGKFYEPQTTTGHYAQTAGEFLPNMLGGPEALGAKLLTRVAAPAALSEGAGQLTKGSALEPLARFGGAVAGGVGASKFLAPAAIAPPTAAQNLGASRLAYKHPEVRAIEIDPRSTAQAADSITSHLNNEGFRDIIAPTTFRLVQELKTPVGPTAKIADIAAVKTALNKVASTPGPEGGAAKTAISQIDKYLTNLSQPELLAGNATTATRILKQAAGDWRSGKQLEMVNETLAKAERQANRAHSGTNIDNATRQKFSAILDNPKRAKFFTTEEKEQMQKIVDGTFTGNLLRKVSKLLPSTGMAGMLQMGAAGAAAVPTHGLSLLAPVAGMAAKGLSNRATAKQVEELQRMIAMNSSVGRSLPAQSPYTAPLVNGLLSGLTQRRASY